MSDRSRGRTRVMSYGEAARNRRDVMDITTEGFMRLVRGEVQVMTTVSVINDDNDDNDDDRTTG